jgi:gp16 family phage-associated protein
MQEMEKQRQKAKAQLRRQGKTISQFASENGLPYQAVRDVLAGRSVGNFGKAHEAAVKLGIKEAA